MRRFFKSGLALLLSVLTASAPAVLEWFANPSEENVIGYQIYRGPESRVYSSIVDVGNVVSYEIPNLKPGITEFYALSAENTVGVSELSNEVSYRPSIFITWRLPEGAILIESCDDLTEAVWSFLALIVGPVDYLISVDPDVPQRFYRYSPALGSSSTGILNRKNTVLRSIAGEDNTVRVKAHR